VPTLYSAVGLIVWTAAADSPPHGGQSPDPGSGSLRGGQHAAGAGGGEDCGSAIPIAQLPFLDSGTTRDRVNDYQPETCSFGGSAGDVVYRYTPTEDVCIDADLCGAFYDTTLMVYAEDCATEIACNDDRCDFQSQITDLNLTGGTTYYFVVDGFDAGEGTYTLVVEQCPQPCHLQCPAGGLDEGEPDCGDHGDDTVNGGCNEEIPAFTSINPGDTYCGTAEWDTEFPIRDTDWYKLVLPEDAVLTWTIEPEFDALIGVINNFGVDVCFGAQFLVFEYAARCQVTSVSECFPAGTWYLWAGADFRGPGFTCGGDYVVHLDVDPAPAGCVPPPCAPQCPGEGSCLEDTGSPGCDDEECCCKICTYDPFCCNFLWDDVCAQAAEFTCFDPPVGACCIESTGECVTGVTSAVCELTHLGRWGGPESTCATIDPPCVPPAVGRCCFRDGSCERMDHPACYAAGGSFAGVGTDCLGDEDDDGRDDGCPPIDVPAVGVHGRWILIGVFVTAIVLSYRRGRVSAGIPSRQRP